MPAGIARARSRNGYRHHREVTDEPDELAYFLPDDLFARVQEFFTLLTPAGSVAMLIELAIRLNGRTEEEVAAFFGYSLPQVRRRRQRARAALALIAAGEYRECGRCDKRLPVDARRDRVYCRDTSACRVAAKRDRDKRS
jgi:DNA-directed RNA polymerase specialized sigma24 family protein